MQDMKMGINLKNVVYVMDRLKIFILSTERYGKPSSIDIKYFVDNFYYAQKNGNFILDIKLELDNWVNEASKNICIEFTGGYEFYKAIEQHTSFETPDEMQDYILNYQYEKPESTDDSRIRNADIEVEKKDVLSYTIEDFNSEVLGIDGKYLLKLATKNLNILIKGVPGTGKTVAAYALAQLLCKEKNSDRITRIQINSNYGYTNFMCSQAYSPNGTYENVLGILLEIANKAEKDPDNAYVLIMDELSRGNIQAILGEGLTYIEKSHRNERFTTMFNTIGMMPSNLYIIASMNECDLSVKKIDKAIIERFKTVNVYPVWENKELIHKLDLDVLQMELVEKIAELNRSIQSPEDKIGNRVLFSLLEGDSIDSIIDNNIIESIESIFEYDNDELVYWTKEFQDLLKKVDDILE